MSTRFLLVALSLVLSGCLLPKPSVMPATSLDCTVIDKDSKEPIANASLFMVYEGPNGEVVKEGPFVTGADGQATIKVERRAIWMKGTDSYFAGGYLRHIEVTAPGYKATGRWENFDFGLLERLAPFTFELER